MKYIVLISATLGVTLLYLLSRASANSAASGDHYTLLLGLNIALALALLILIGVQLWRLYQQMRQNVMGSRLTLRLLGTFALMAIIPGMIVYAVSVSFLTRSIESWFNVKVEAALDGGLRLGQSTLDIMLTDLEEKSEIIANGLAFVPNSSQLVVLTELREQSAVQDAVLITQQGRILAYSSHDPKNFLPDMPSLSQLRQAKNRVFKVIEPIPNKGLYLRVLKPVITADLAGETHILQLMQPVPAALSSTAESVQNVYQDYQELSFSRNSLKQVFALTLTLVLMLAMLTAVAIAFLLSRRISEPLSILAEGTRAIARGDYSNVLPAHGKDELGILVKSFNSMTQQLGEATQAAEKNRARVEAARKYLETILAHLSSGVIALDDQLHLRTYNSAAQDILDVDLSKIVRQPLQELAKLDATLSDFTSAIETHIRQSQERLLPALSTQIEIPSSSGKKVILLRGTRLMDSAEVGYVIVFDDVTTVVQAQRDAAWGEVARRLAHEIKNPLTPIQLSAERLEHKLAAKLDSSDLAMLKRSTATIVSQVSAMKSMVNEFSEYARAPSLNLAEIDLNALIHDVLALYETSSASIVLALDDTLPPIQGDSTMLRQVLHNLLQNAQDAVEDSIQPKIEISTQLKQDKITLTIHDNGKGFPADILPHVFEPYMTTKRHGTGLGLAIVKKIIEEHKAQIKVENAEQGGANVALVFSCLVHNKKHHIRKALTQ